MPGHGAMTKSGKLRENEPHPVTLLPAAPQFVENTRVDRQLSVEEALKVEGIGHGAETAARSTSRSRRTRWLSSILTSADGRSNHAARSISGKDCIFPPFGGHSISKVLLLMASTSRSLTFDSERDHPL